MGSSILSRKFDLLYLVFFLIHVPIVITVDAFPLWPQTQVPQFMVSLRQYYISNYKDNFFINPPSWFLLYITAEALYHLPLSLWAIYGLFVNSPMVPVHLLVYAVQTGVTTATCITEALSWKGLTNQEKGNLMGLYVPYLGVSLLMGVDVFLRLSKIVREHALNQETKKLR